MSYGSPESWKDITVRHLLTGTSGIVRDPLERDYEPYREQPKTDVIKAAYPIPLRASPGEKWSYSNVGYYVLAEIISRASGKTWNEFIAERLFVPAGMTDTRLTTTAEIVPNRASGYRNTSKGRVNAEDWIAPRPSGAFLSTVLDLAKWDAFLDSTSILADSSKRQMWTRATLASGAPTNYGFGWIVDSFLGRARIHHDGQFPGFRSDYERFQRVRSEVFSAICDQAERDHDHRALTHVVLRMQKSPARAGLCFRTLVKSARFRNVRGLRSFLSLDYLELDLVPFSERLETGSADCAEMDENVGPSLA